MPLRGTVIDNKDPYQRGRCRVRVWGMHKEDDPNLPWAETMGSTMFGLHKGVGYSGVLQEGTTVWVDFEQSDLQCPIIVGVFVGHDAETMEEINPDTSDFHPDAKGPNYGHVWLMTTPGGNRLEFNDIDKRVTLKTACGPEMTLDCGKKQAFITNGNASIRLDGDQIIVDGHMKVSGSVVAPNLCYCGPGGAPSGGSDAANEARNERCGPTVDGDNISCNGDTPPQANLSELQEPLRKLVERAQQIYKEKHGAEMKIYETKMSPERYLCLSKAGVNVSKEQLYGYGVTAFPHDKEFPVAVQSPSTPGSTSPTGQEGTVGTGNGVLAGGVSPDALKFPAKQISNRVLENYVKYGWCSLEKKYGLPPGYLAAIHAKETGNTGKQCCRSYVGAAGPFQFMPNTWPEVARPLGYNTVIQHAGNKGGTCVDSGCRGDVFDFKKSATAAALYLSKIRTWGGKKTWTWLDVAYGYNSGPNGMAKRGGGPANNAENRNYGPAVMGYLRWFQENKGGMCPV